MAGPDDTGENALTVQGWGKRISGAPEPGELGQTRWGYQKDFGNIYADTLSQLTGGSRFNLDSYLKNKQDESRIAGGWIPSESETKSLETIAKRLKPNAESTDIMQTLAKIKRNELQNTEFLQKLRDSSLKIFPRFDQNNDHKLSEVELGKALMTNYSSVDETRAAASLFLGRHMLHELEPVEQQTSPDGFKERISKMATGKSLSEAGINRISELGKINNLSPVIDLLAKTGFFLEMNWQTIAGKDSTVMTKEAIDQAIASGKFTDKIYLEKLQFASSNFDEIKSFAEGRSSEPIEALTHKNLNTLKAAADHYQGKRLLTLLENISQSAEKIFTIDPVATKLYGQEGNWLKELVWPTGPNKEAIQMGGLLSCMLLAPLNGMNESTIRNSIKDNKDGTFTVTFPADPKHPVRVDAPSNAMQAAFNQRDTHGSWASIIESAADRYFHDKNKGESSPYVPGEALLSMGNAIGVGEMTQLLSGKQADGWDLDQSSDKETFAAIEEALSQGRAVTVGTGNFILAGDLPLLNNHAISVQNIERGSDGNLVISLRDPFGRQSKAGKTDGNFKLTGAQFMKHLAFVIIEGTEPFHY